MLDFFYSGEVASASVGNKGPQPPSMQNDKPTKDLHGEPQIFRHLKVISFPPFFHEQHVWALEKLVGFYRRSCWLFGAQPSVSLQTKRLDLLMIPWRWQHGSFQEELPFRFRVIFNFHDGRKGNLPTKWAPSPVISYE